MSPRSGAVADRLRGRRELELDVRLQLLVITYLLEGLLGERERRASVMAVIPDPGQEQQRLGAERTRGRRCDCFFQTCRRLAEFASLERELAGMDRPMDPRFGVVGGGQLASEIRQLGRSVRGAPAARMLRRSLEFGGDTLVRPLCGKRKVSRPLLLVDDHRREPPVSLPPLVAGRHRVLNRREQRVGRPDAPGAVLDHSVVEGSFDVVVGVCACDRLRNQRSRGLRRGRGDQEHVPDRIREPRQPVGDQVDERRRHRERGAGP